MDLIKRLKAVAKQEGISESELILDEARAFLREHGGHGGYELQVLYDNQRRVRGIYLECSAMGIVNTERCSHHNPRTPAELSYSIIYQDKNFYKEPTREIRMQAERRKKS